MSILVDQHTRLVVQGLTGREGGFHRGQVARGKTLQKGHQYGFGRGRIITTECGPRSCRHHQPQSECFTSIAMHLLASLPYSRLKALCHNGGRRPALRRR